MSHTPPGWYADPGAPATPGQPPPLRWWDGVQWTGHVQHPQHLVPAPAGPTTPDGQPLAGWWWRVLAVVVDALVVGIPSLLVTLPWQIRVQGELNDLERELESDAAGGGTVDLGQFFADSMQVYADHVVGLFVLPALLGLAYHAVFLRWKGATPGKLVCGLQVRLRARHGRLPWPTIARRLLAQTVLPMGAYTIAILSGSVLAAALTGLAVGSYVLTDYLWALGARRQTLHDKLARTNVVRTRP